MKTSITRGLATSAVTALTATGLAMATTPAAHAAAPEVELLSQFTGIASLAFDNNSSTARLTAQVDDPAAAVTFQVNPDPEAGAADAGWREIGAASQVVGTIAFRDWDGHDASGRSWTGERVALRVTAANADGASYAVRGDVEVTGGLGDDGVSLTTFSARYFTQPYADSGHVATTVRVAGVTSASSGTVALSSWRSSDGAFTGRTVAEVEPVSSKLPGDYDDVVSGRFDAGLELTPAEVEAGTVTLAAERGSDDVLPVSLVPQTIGSITAYPSEYVPTGQPGQVTVVVSDPEGNPVLGAEVRRLSDGVVVGYTDRDGVVRATQPGGSTEEYYANATDADGFAAEDGDVQSGPVTTDSYEPVASYVDTVLGDGPVFDVDEYAAGDLAALVYDNQGRPVGAGESVSYKVYPSDEEAPADYRTALTNADGIAVLDFDATGASGSHTVASVLTSQAGTTEPQLRTFTTGEATMLLSPKASPVVTDAGGQVDYFGRLLVEGEPLAGRVVDLTYTRGTEAVPGDAADAGIVAPEGLALDATRTTNGNGSFRVTVDDLDETPQASEFDGMLSAVTGTTETTETSSVTGNAGAGADSGTVFGSAGPGTAEIRLRGVGNGRAADRLRVTGPTTLAGETVEAFRVNARGKRVLVTTRTLNRFGDKPSIRVADGNGRRTTTYVVRLVGSDRVASYVTEPLSLR
jgi:hypothetical protein